VTALLEAVASAVNKENARNEIFLRNTLYGRQPTPAKTLGVIYHSRLILQDSTSLISILSLFFNLIPD
jgi:hypothetical protein